MKRTAERERKTKETQIRAKLVIDGSGRHEVATGIGFFDHMLTLLSVHGLVDLSVAAEGDIDVDLHHTVEDVGLVLGETLNLALGDRKGVARYGHAVIPMDDALAEVTVDLSNRPYMKIILPDPLPRQNDFDASLAKEFFRALAQKAGMNLHIRIAYGDNWHHMIEAVFKGLGRALRQAAAVDKGVHDVPSSKGSL
jgi:imidazoleglycerol-phosphate dehydratase